jgi:hypothetical protein
MTPCGAASVKTAPSWSGFVYADRQEAFEAGDAFYTPPGHIPVKHEPGSSQKLARDDA